MRSARAYAAGVALLGLLASLPARAAVAFDAETTANTYTTSGTTITNSSLTVGSGANRALVAILVLSSNTPGATSCTWDSGGSAQAMTLIVTASGASSGQGSVLLYGLVNPVSGNKTLSCTVGGFSDQNLSAASFTGADQTGGTTTFKNSNAAASTSGNPSNTITSATGDMVVDGAGAQHTFTGHGASQTQIFVNNTGSFVAAAGSYASGAASVAMTWTQNTGTGYWVDAALDIAAAVAGGHNLSLLGVGQ